MSYRSRRYPLDAGVVDVETARRAIAEVARERDAVVQQLHRVQAQASALERQLHAQEAENAELLQVVRSLEAREPRLVETVREPEPRAAASEAPAGAPTDRERRLAADLANLRRHQTEAIERGVRAQSDHLLVEIASVRDSVDRAIASLPEGSSPWHDGLLAVIARIDGVLSREGVQRTGAPGERFDPAVHEAVGTVPGEDGTVRQTVSTGLVRQDGSVIVPAKVLVGTGHGEAL